MVGCGWWGRVWRSRQPAAPGWHLSEHPTQLLHAPRGAHPPDPKQERQGKGRTHLICSETGKSSANSGGKKSSAFFFRLVCPGMPSSMTWSLDTTWGHRGKREGGGRGQDGRKEREGV